MKIFKRILQSLAWVKILSNYDSSDFKSAISIYEKNFSGDDAKSHHIALYATLLLLDKNEKEAKNLFFSIKNENKTQTERDKYIYYYVSYYLSLINGEKESKYFLKKALDSEASDILKRWLPLSE